MKKDIVVGVVSGIALYLTFAIVGYIPYIFFSLNTTVFAFNTCCLCGGLIIAISVFLKNNHIRSAFMRTIFMIITMLSTIVFNGSIGTIKFVDRVFNIVENEANSRATGLLLTLFLIVLFVVCLISITVFILTVFVRKTKMNKGEV